MDEQELATIKDEDKKAQSSGRSTTSYGFAIDSTRIRSAPLADQSAALQQLGVDVFNQEDFEEGVLRQVDEAIAVKETQEAIEGWERELKAVDEDIRLVWKLVIFTCVCVCTTLPSYVTSGCLALDRHSWTCCKFWHKLCPQRSITGG